MKTKVQHLNWMLRDMGYIGLVPEGATVTELLVPEHMIKAEWDVPSLSAEYSLTMKNDGAFICYGLPVDGETHWSIPIEVTKLPDFEALKKRLDSVDAFQFEGEVHRIQKEIFQHAAYDVRVEMYKEMIKSARTKTALDVINVLLPFDKVLRALDWGELEVLRMDRAKEVAEG